VAVTAAIRSVSGNSVCADCSTLSTWHCIDCSINWYWNWSNDCCGHEECHVLLTSLIFYNFFINSKLSKINDSLKSVNKYYFKSATFISGNIF